MVLPPTPTRSAALLVGFSAHLRSSGLLISRLQYLLSNTRIEVPILFIVTLLLVISGPQQHGKPSH